jgi:NAD(P)-dependent dehydrogenase (short-subunit alcohol dehydrogenase family)
MMTLAPRTALVTGSRRGIGRAIAFALADAGFAIALNDIVADAALEETMAGLETRGAAFHFVPGDIAQVESHAGMLDVVEAALGPIGCLVNNAGVQVAERVDLLETTPAVFDRLIGVNLRGTFFLTQAVARRMLATEGEGRSIITISSINAAMASIEKAPYCLSKAGLSMTNQLFALRLAAHGIAVFEIRPGLIRTDMTAPVRDSYSAAIADGLSPIARWGEPEDVAGAVSALATGAMPFSTGGIYNIDGGVQLAKL